MSEEQKESIPENTNNSSEKASPEEERKKQTIEKNVPLSSPPRPSAPWPCRRRRPGTGRPRAQPSRRHGARTTARRGRPRARLEGRW